ncbi:PfkB family carbohydrate kinase [Microlunatus aurantiacus]|uniref:PfkB family carbohydrate kinase n=1 Tax=Microlunatus aurantiacus TaxID=446786 RepID=A0ABP7D966_9ACTN
MSTPAYDVICLGEVLVEVATTAPFGHDVPAVLGISGDTLNVAAAAAAAGARVGLVAVLTDDDLGRAIAARVAELGIGTDLLRFAAGQQGVYLVHSDPAGEREFSYARSGSVGSSLSPEHLPAEALARAGAVVASGIAGAISVSARAAVRHAADGAQRFVYDPNHRPRLSDADAAADLLRELAPQSWLITPSHPGETAALLGATSPDDAAQQLRARGTVMVAVTCGASGVQVVDADRSTWIPAVPAPAVVDQTGAGDAYVGTLTARLVLGDDLVGAARLAAAASSLVVGGRGGTGLVPTLDRTRAHLRAHGTTAQEISG